MAERDRRWVIVTEIKFSNLKKACTKFLLSVSSWYGNECYLGSIKAGEGDC